MSLYTTFFYQQWQMDDGEKEATIEQASLPIFASVPLTKEIWLFCSETNAQSKWSEKSETLRGIGDTKLKVSYNSAENHTLLTIGISLPTGKNTMTISEAHISKVLHQEGLGFKVRRLGEGLNVNVGVARAYAIGSLTFCVGTNYLFKGGYESLTGSPEYNPSDRIKLTGGFDIGTRSLAWQNDATVTLFTPERLGSWDSFQQGSEIILESRLSYRIVKSQTRLLLREIIRGKNKLPDAEGRLQTVETNRYGHRTNVSLVEEYRLSRRLHLRGLAEVKRIAPNDKGSGYGLIYGLGLGMRMRLSRSYVFDIGLKLSRGSIESEKIDVSGLGMSAAVISMF